MSESRPLPAADRAPKPARWRLRAPRLGIGWRLLLGLAAVGAVLVAGEERATRTTRAALEALSSMQHEHQPLARSANAVLEKLAAFDRAGEDAAESAYARLMTPAIKFAVSLGLEPMYVTEDTTRCDPEMIKKLYSTAIENGARAIVVCDTAGHATPMGAYSLVRFVIEQVVKPSGEKIRVDWHGHCDRGLGVPNAMAALVAGADCVHGSALGVGERVGNTQIDQMLVNLKLMKVDPWTTQDLTRLKDYCNAVAHATGIPIPANYPVVGEDAFRTATGVHAAALVKAFKKNDVELANAVYSGVPSHFFGLEQVIDIGPMSGKSNVVYWLEHRGIPATDELVDRVFARAKKSDHTLTDAEILECVTASRPHH